MDSESLLMNFVAVDGISRVVRNIGQALESFRAKLPEIGAALDNLFTGKSQAAQSLAAAIATLEAGGASVSFDQTAARMRGAAAEVRAAGGVVEMNAAAAAAKAEAAAAKVEAAAAKSEAAMANAATRSSTAGSALAKAIAQVEAAGGTVKLDVAAVELAAAIEKIKKAGGSIEFEAARAVQAEGAAIAGTTAALEKTAASVASGSAALAGGASGIAASTEVAVAKTAASAAGVAAGTSEMISGVSVASENVIRSAIELDTAMKALSSAMGKGEGEVLAASLGVVAAANGMEASVKTLENASVGIVNGAAGFDAGMLAASNGVLVAAGAMDGALGKLEAAGIALLSGAKGTEGAVVAAGAAVISAAGGLDTAISALEATEAKLARTAAISAGAMKGIGAELALATKSSAAELGVAAGELEVGAGEIGGASSLLTKAMGDVVIGGEALNVSTVEFNASAGGLAGAAGGLEVTAVELDASAVAATASGAELTVGAGLFATAAAELGAALGPLVIALTAAAAALVVIGAGVLILDKLATKTSDYSLQVERNSVLLNKNTDLYQTVVQGLNVLGTTTQQVNVQLTRFNRNLEVGAPGLKALHTSLKDLGIAGLPADEAFIKLTDDLSKMTNQSEKLAITQALFSQRTGPQFAEFLSTMGGQFNSTTTNLQELTAELSKFGLVLNQGQLAVGGLAAIAHQRLGMALKGIEMQVGARLETAFMLLWNVMEKVFTNGAGLIYTITDALAKAVVWVTAFVAAMFNVKLTMDMFTNSTTPVLDKLGLFQQSQEDAAKATQDANSALQDQIAALQDQKAALTDAQTAVDEGYVAQIDKLRELKAAQDDTFNSAIQQLQDQKAAQDQTYSDATSNLKEQKTAQDEVFNAQISALDAQKKVLELQQRQHDMNLTLEQDQANLAMTQEELAAAKFLNNGSVSIGGLLARQADEEKKLARDKEKAHYDSTINKLEASRAAIQAEKKAGDDMYDDKIKQIDLERKAYDTALTERIKGYNKQKKAADDVLDDQVKNLEKQKKAYDDTIKDEMRILDHQTRELQEQLRQQTKAAKDANTEQLGSANTMANAVSQLMSDLTSGISKNFTTAGADGASAFEQIKQAAITVKDAILNVQIIYLQLSAAFSNLNNIVGLWLDLDNAIVSVLTNSWKAAGVLDDLAHGNLGKAADDFKKLTDGIGEIGRIAAAAGKHVYGLFNPPTSSINAQIAYLQAQLGGVGGGGPDQRMGTGGGITYGDGGMINEPVMGYGLRTGMRYSFGDEGPEMVVPKNADGFMAAPGAPQPIKPSGGGGGTEKTRDVLMEILDTLTAIANDKPAPGGYAASMRAG